MESQFISVSPQIFFDTTSQFLEKQSGVAEPVGQ